MRRAAQPFRDIVDATAAAEYRERGWWGDVTLSAVVRDRAKELPDATAFVAEGSHLTWRGYDAAADRLAAVFSSCATEPGQRISLLLPDTATIHVALIAAERA